MTIRYDIYGRGQYKEERDEVLIASTFSSGICYMVIQTLKEHYTHIRIEQHKQKGKVQS